MLRLRPVFLPALIVCLAAFGGLSPNVLAADRLILRNLDFVLGRTVVAIDEDGVRLDAPRPGGTDHLRWDEIERGTVALDQPKFDRLLGDLGLPLYRIRQRLKAGDYAALAEPAAQMYPRFSERNSLSAYMVCQARMWSLLAGGQREAAVEPYLRCYHLLRSGAINPADLPGPRRLQIDAQTALSPDLAPVWFDAAAAKEALPGVQEAIRSLTPPRPEGVYVYYATLALAAGEAAEAERVLGSIRGVHPITAGWRSIVLAQQELQAGAPGPHLDALRASLHSLPESCLPAGHYWVGMALVGNPDEGLVRDGILHLLRLPAEFGDREPELAAAGLYEAALTLAKLKEERASAAVRSELAASFAATYFGRLAALEAGAAAEGR